MKIVSVTQARSIWLFDTSEMNPAGLDLWPVVLALQDRYEFQKWPKAEEARMVASLPNGLEFKGGAFRAEDGQDLLVAVTIYNDGLVAETYSSTLNTDEFLRDLLNFVSSEFQLRFDDSMVRQRLYLSQVVVSFDAALDSLHQKLSDFCDLLTTILERDLAPPFRVSGIHFGTDPSSGKAAVFRLERKAGASYDQNRYFSEAPTSTDKHLALIGKLEELLRA